jgi:hypothetical protein
MATLVHLQSGSLRISQLRGDVSVTSPLSALPQDSLVEAVSGFGQLELIYPAGANGKWRRPAPEDAESLTNHLLMDIVSSC